MENTAVIVGATGVVGREILNGDSATMKYIINTHDCYDV